MRTERPRAAARRAVALLASALVTAFGAACGAPGRGEAAAATPGSAATAAAPLALDAPVPAYDATTLAGERVRVGGEAAPLTLVNVWATWCASCREEMQDLEAMQRDYKARGLRVIAVSVDEGSVERVRRFVEREKLTMPIAHDPEGTIQRLYSVVGVPETFLIAPDGRLVWKQAGGLHGAPEAARKAVEAALTAGATN